MKTRKSQRAKKRGFVLVLVVACLSSILLILVALGALLRVDSESAAAGAGIGEANRNALFALRLAIGQLQRFAGAEGVVTARAVAVDPLAANPNWCGVWPVDEGGGPLVWLVNGNERDPYAIAAAFPVGSDPDSTVLLVDATNLAWQVRVVKSTIRARHPGVGGEAVVGRYAFWVSDESTKLCVNRRSDAPLPSGVASYPDIDVAAILGGSGLSESVKAKLLMTDQLAHAGVSLAAARKQFVTVSTERLHVSGGTPMLTAAPFNVNSVSHDAWLPVLNAANAELGDADADSLIESIVVAPHPFRSMEAFRVTLQQALDVASSMPASAAAVLDKLAPVLTVRGDTFLIRAYGETVDPLDNGATSIASAYGEARVQRMPQELSDGAGWKFVVTYFRWLGPDDI